MEFHLYCRSDCYHGLAQFAKHLKLQWHSSRFHQSTIIRTMLNLKNNSLDFNSRTTWAGVITSGEFSWCANQVAWALCLCVGVCVRRSEAGVSGDKGQVSSAADECRSYISSRPPQTPEQWVSTSQHVHIAPSMSSPAAICLLKIDKLLKLFFSPLQRTGHSTKR